MTSTRQSDASLGQEVSAAEIRAFLRDRGMDLLTFTGYSAAGYEDHAAMLAHANEILRTHDPRRTMVNIGATAEGIGAVYELAKEKGFLTMGIVSTLARDEEVRLSPHLDHLFYVRDETWGGRLPGSSRLSPTSAAIVDSSSAIVGIGGGEIARDEKLAARQAGIPVVFIAADMNHARALEKADRQGLVSAEDFQGAAHAVLSAEDRR
jgi:hypothetical protein